MVHCLALVSSCHRLGTAAPDAGKAISERPWGVPRGMQAQSCITAAVSAVIRVGERGTDSRLFIFINKDGAGVKDCQID